MRFLFQTPCQYSSDLGKEPEQLLRDARSGREAAFLRLFDDHHLPLFRFAWRLTGSIPDAEDIVQECFFALLRPGCSFDPAHGDPHLFFGAVRNQSLNRLRRREQGLESESTELPKLNAVSIKG